MSEMKPLQAFDAALLRSIEEARAERLKEAPAEAPKPVVMTVPKRKGKPARFDYYNTAQSLTFKQKEPEA